ncbi:hypothetical protein TEA_002657 [Camellia sinensis var. sinensis]|uniref:Uncharacterized protein n=1 Tax=Camellia sinensis var. sinensis TaxID=542762 RepID=A0A4S4D0H5_CAMSN|nr:hypothetical protein TEA_002657 [Camellia sinensis var. sinensis]
MCKCIAKVDCKLIGVRNKKEMTPLFLAALNGTFVDELKQDKVREEEEERKKPKLPENYQTCINIFVLFRDAFCVPSQENLTFPPNYQFWFEVVKLITKAMLIILGCGRSWAKLLQFEPTYRYSGRRKARVTNFLLEDAPEPDPSLPEIRLIPLTAEEEMAKRNRVRALLTETTRLEVTPPSQSQPAVVALLSQQPSSSRRTKRVRTAETEQILVDEAEPALPPSLPSSPQPKPSDRTTGSWAPKLTFNDRDIRDTDSIVAEKDHLLAINLAKGVCLPKDMEHHQKQLNTKLKAIRSTTKSMILAIQKNQITHRKVLELRKVTRQAAAEAEAKAAELRELQQFLEGSDSNEDSAPEDTPVANVDQVVRSEPTVEDLSIEQPGETVVPTETTLATENVLPPETGLQVDADAAFDAEIEDLFS